MKKPRSDREKILAILKAEEARLEAAHGKVIEDAKQLARVEFNCAMALDAVRRIRARV